MKGRFGPLNHHDHHESSTRQYSTIGKTWGHPYNQLQSHAQPMIHFSFLQPIAALNIPHDCSPASATAIFSSVVTRSAASGACTTPGALERAYDGGCPTRKVCVDGALDSLRRGFGVPPGSRFQYVPMNAGIAP